MNDKLDANIFNILIIILNTILNHIFQLHSNLCFFLPFKIIFFNYIQNCTFFLFKIIFLNEI